MYHFSIAPESFRGETYGITNLELKDGCFGAPLCELSGAQIEDLRDELIDRLCRIALYETTMHVTEQERYVLFFRRAHLLAVENVFLPWEAIAGADDAAIRAIIAMGESFSIRVLFQFYAEHLEEFGPDRYMALRSEATGLVYDPIEYVKQHIQPYRYVLYKCAWKDDIRFLRIRDAVYDSLTPVLPGTGNAEVRECASGLLLGSYTGYFSFGAYSDTLPMPEVIRAFGNALRLL